MIYKILDNNKEFKSFNIDIEEYLDMMDPTIGEDAAMQFSQNNVELSPHWKPLEVTYFQNEGCGEAIPDIGIWRGASLIMSERAVDVLKAFIEEFGELLPVTCEGKPHWIFNCRQLVDADESKSKRIEEDGYFMDVEALVFPDDTNANIFKSKFENCRNLFCLEAFKEAVESNKLGGINFSADLVDFM